MHLLSPTAQLISRHSFYHFNSPITAADHNGDQALVLRTVAAEKQIEIRLYICVREIVVRL